MQGTTLAGRYEVLSEIGRGGMGTVYLANDSVLLRKVALKLVDPSAISPEHLERFRREARILATMDHPAIVGLHDIGEHEGHLFLIMPYVPGHNLRPHILDASLSLGEMVDIGIHVADALDYSHQLGIIHRDIKPENILVTKSGSGNLRVRITDFGLAMVCTDRRLSQSGALLGTIQYFSPEQVYEHDLDGRTDIYSLGTVLYECITGELPFSGDLEQVLYRIVHEMPAPLGHHGFNIDPELEDILMQCLQKDREKRPVRAGIVSEALTRYKNRLLQSGKFEKMIPTPRLITVARPPRTALIGRENELVRLQQHLNAAIEGQCQLVLLGGEPGIGRTRLLDELEMLARARRVQVLHGRFVGEEQGFRFQGFCEAIQEYFRYRVTTAIPASAPSLDFSDLAADLRSIFPVLGEIAEIKSSSSANHRIDPLAPSPRLEDQTAVFDLLARSVIRIGAGKPLLLLLEELHTAEASAEALQHVVRRMAPTPTMVIATYRTNEVHKRHALVKMISNFEGDRRFAHVVLQPFPYSEHRAFLESMLGSEQLDEDLVTRIFETTEGNPYFARELTQSLIDSGRIVQVGTGGWVLSDDDVAGSPLIPETIQQTVERRLRELNPELYETLLTASILGKHFQLRDLRSITERAERLDDIVEQLIHKGFIEEERFTRGDRLFFSSEIVREVLYSALPRRKRKAYHVRFAQHLEKRNVGRLDRVYPKLVHHYSKGDEPAKVVEYGLKLAQSSVGAFSPEEAIRAGRTVLEFLEEDEAGIARVEAAEARIAIASAHRLDGNLDAALQELNLAIRVLHLHREPKRLLEAIVIAAETAWAARKIQETQSWIEEGLPAARRMGEQGALNRLLSLAATVANLRGDYEKAMSLLEEADECTTANAVEEKSLPGGRLLVALPFQVRPMHPIEIKLDEEAEILANVFEQMVKMDNEGNFVPWLCENWDILDGGRVFRFTLRSGLRTHDGTLLEARDVRDSFEHSIANSPYNRPAAFAAIDGVDQFLTGRNAHVSGIRVVSPQEIEFHLKEALPVFPALLTEMRTAVVRRESGGAWRTGTGPFCIASYGADSVLLERNSNYWRGTSPVIDELQFQGGLSAAAMGAGFRAGQFDLVRDLLPQDLEDVFRQRPLRATLAEATKKNVYFLLFNGSSQMCGIPELRRAMCGVVRRPDLIRRTVGRFAQPAEGLYPPGILGHDPERRTSPMDLETARALLRAGGLTPPLHLKASVHPIFQDRYSSLTASLLSLWSDLGIEVSIETQTMESFLRSLRHNDGIDLLVGRWIAEYEDPDDFTYTLFHSKGGDRAAYVASDELDRWMEAARSENRTEAREALYRRIESSLLESASFFPLFHEIDFRLGSTRVRNLSLKSTAPYVNYADVIKMPDSAASSARAAGGRLDIPIAGRVPSLDPALVTTAVESQVTPAIFETLFRQTEGTIVPWLVEKFEAQEGGRRFWFRLRSNVRFHDGRRLTARDVRYSFERLLSNPESDSRLFFSGIRGAAAMLKGERGDLEGFRILSATDFVMQLDQPVSFFPALLAYYSAAIVPEGTVEFRSTWRDGCAGTGPYRVVRFRPGEQLELEANPFYWRSGFPRNDRLVFTFNLTPREVFEQFRSGEFSVASDLLPDDVEKLLHEPRFASRCLEIPRLCTYFAVFNRHRGLLADEEVRRAVVDCVDVDKLIRKSLGRLAVPADGLIPPGLLGHERRHSVRSSASAKRVGAERELTCALNPVYSGPYSVLADELFAAFRQAGFRVKVLNEKPGDYREFHELLEEAKADFALARWVGDYPDSDTFAGILQSDQKIAGRFCGSAEIDRLIVAGRSETEPQRRSRIYAQVEATLERDALLLPLFHEQVFCFAAPNVEGFELNFFSPLVAYEKLHIQRL